MQTIQCYHDNFHRVSWSLNVCDWCHRPLNWDKEEDRFCDEFCKIKSFEMYLTKTWDLITLNPELQLTFN